ncbi:hypothetical protein UPYG_G00252400 [Umbra pygmaea]|uniref:BZIP domain-containing protein n=1 Tax=Umbra pygmaea TaxID=75934 RepID=A0ABD0WPI7_UMBPY
MSDLCKISVVHSKNQSMYLLQRCESYGDDGDEDSDRRFKRREKNRVAAQKSRKRQTKRADELHEAYECLEQKNRLLKKEVQFLTEEMCRLTETLKNHERHCPIMHCVASPGSGPGI